MKWAYYNENDPKAAAWLEELINQGHIAPGVVDERSIEDVRPDDLRKFGQCHFFAGIGVWSYALRLAGWPDDKPVWTGSCPCQPFSSAGKRKGTSDERHLWPAWQWLIRECRPLVVFGEQVASKDGIAWLDTVSSDLEGEGYAVGSVVLPACGVGAPHIRSRTWFVADSNGRNEGSKRQQRSGKYRLVSENSLTCESLEHAEGNGRIERRPESIGWSPLGGRGLSQLGDAHGERTGRDPGAVLGAESETRLRSERDRLIDPGPVNGHWSDAEWIYCRDEKWRPVEPGSFPLAYGAPARVGRLRGYGNAIVAQAAAEIIKAYGEVKR